jgi:hypothetical protein
MAISFTTVPSPPVQDILTQLADELKFSQVALNATMQDWEKLQLQSASIALNCSFQNELNLIHKLYQNLIALTIQNIKAQHAVTCLIHTDISHELNNSPDRQFIRKLMSRLLRDLVPLEEQFRDYNKAEKMLASRIATLIKTQYPTIACPNFWKSVNVVPDLAKPL